VAQIGFTFDEEALAPHPDEFNPDARWPSPLSNAFFFDTYADRERNGAYAFGVFFVNKSDFNFFAGCAGLLGGWSSLPDDNAVPFSPFERFTYLFVPDITYYNTVCDPNPIQNVMVHYLTHELGHQRAGLTHPENANAAQYHTGTVPAGRLDIMHAVLGGDNEFFFAIPVFDSFDPPNPNVNTSCQSNLLYFKSINN
jgi:hypothetical protein